MEQQNLLLAYHFFLNKEQTAKISSGIHPILHESIIIISKLGEKKLTFNYELWIAFNKIIMDAFKKIN